MKRAVGMLIILLLSVASAAEARIWQEPGRNSFRKSPEFYSPQQLRRDYKALIRLGLDKTKAKEIIANHRIRNSRWGQIETGDTFEKMIFGNYKIWQDEPIVVGFDKTVMARVYDIDDEYELWYPLVCGNWAIRKKSKPAAEYPPVPRFRYKKNPFPKPAKVKAAVLPPVPRYKETGAALKKKKSCGLDLYTGGGIYETDRWMNSNNKDYYHDGWYAWIKGRARPFGFNVTDRISACLGVFGFGATGGGDDEDYLYDWWKGVVGPSLKLIGHKDNWDMDIDLGWGRQVSKGKINLYRSKQTDDLLVASAHVNLYDRRVQGEKGFSKTELNVEFTLPSNQKHEHSWDGNPLDPDPHNNQVLEITLTQHIYDFEISDNLLLTPGVNLAYINENGLESPDFIQFGPRLTMAWHGEDILSVSPLNYKENLGGDGDQWHWISGYLSVSGLIKAYRSSQITAPTKKDFCIDCP